MQLIETMRVSRGKLENVTWHNERFRRSLRELFGVKQVKSLEELVVLPSTLGRGVYKCRILYDTAIRQVEFLPYRPRPLARLYLVVDDQIRYEYKFADRSVFEKYRRKDPAEDILIVKDGRLTDTSYANIAFYDGEKWLTPAVPLLAGTKRAKLLAEGILHPEELRPTDLRWLPYARLVNAMLVFDQTPLLPTAGIYW